MRNISTNRFQIDWFFLLVLLSIVSCGLIALYSASSGGEYFWRQLIWVGISLLVMSIAIAIPYNWWLLIVPALYVLGLLLGLLVLLVGIEIHNTRRWLDFGVRFQPSELMKLATPLMLAFYYSLIKRSDWLTHLVALILVALPTGLIYIQPDLGTSLILLVSSMMVVFCAGISWRLQLTLAAGAILSLPVLWLFVLKPYMKKRIVTLFSPEVDALGAGYHTIQAEIAVGSGGIYGKGFMAGTQAQLDFLPERHTDFIFAVIAEEAGFFGALILLILILLLFTRGLSIAINHQQRFASLAVLGVLSVYLLTSMVNLSMVSGLLPVVGMPLPLVSYGGSSLLVSMFGFGIIMSVYRARQQNSS